MSAIASFVMITPAASSPNLLNAGDMFATHCVVGFLGTIGMVLFAQKAVAAYGGVEVDGGLVSDDKIR